MAGTLKDSKTRWLGQIPTDWDMVRVKDCFDRKNKKANQKNPIVLSLARSGVKIRDITSNEGQLAADYTNYNPVAKDDILINPMDLVSGDNCNISKVEGVISPAYVNLRYKKGINPRFYNYYFKLQYWLGAFFAHGYGVSFDNRWTLSYEALSKYPIVLPPSEEQIKIADFLDEKCAEIDNLSEDIQKQIEILNDYKKSVITRAVTKGLDPNAEMKDSGIDWIGQIPKGWEMLRIKNLGTARNGLTYSPNDLATEEDGTLVLRSSNVKDGKINLEDNVYVSCKIPSNLMVKKGDILICSRNGSRELIGKNAIIDDIHATYGAFMMVYRSIDPEYLYCILNSEVFSYYLGTFFTSTINQLTGQNFNNMKIVFCPDKNERAKIVEYLKEKTLDIDYSIQIKRQQLDNLNTYKKSIIYEYVTGKKRVKGAL
jgi:putative type I restriction-modification system specificity determinant for hsdM and hsdR (hsdS)